MEAIRDPDTVVPLQPTTEPTRPRRRLALLVAGHLIFGVVAGYLNWVFEPYAWYQKVSMSMMYVGLVYCQTSLLGIWGALGSSSWRWRAVGVITGVGYITTHIGIAEAGFDRVVILVGGFASALLRVLLQVLFATASVLTILLIGRLGRVRIEVPACSAAGRPRFQFSIRHLMGLTFAVACLSAAANWLWAYLPNIGEFGRTALMSVPNVAVGIVSVWAVLGSANWALRGVTFIAVASAADLAIPLLCGWEYFPWPVLLTATLSEALFLALSLWVVRSCGFRLVRRT